MINNCTIILLMTITVLLFSCTSAPYFEQQIEIPNQEWTYADSLIFEVPIQDTTQRYDIYLQIQHSTAYYYQNLYTYLRTIYPSGKSIGARLNFDLANKQGKWYGDCSSEDCTYTAGLQQNVRFAEQGQHQISLQNFMRVDSLQAIEAVTLILRTSDQN